MEAFSLGRPMMLSDIPSFREAVGEKKLEKELYRKCEWGYLVKVNDSQACYAALKDFIEHKNEWMKMQEASFKMAENFNIKITAENYNNVYSIVWPSNKD